MEELRSVYKRSVERSDDCMCCGGKRCVEMYSNNKPLQYTDLLDKGITDMTTMGVTRCMCTQCGVKYSILWQSKVAEPLYSGALIDIFMKSNFMMP